MDTSPDAPGTGVEPIVHRDYDGGVIVLPRSGTRLDPESIPELAAKVGHDIVTSSGDTLLGADDKAGVAEIMAAVAHLAAHPELPRPTLRISFTPDEEIGEGATLFNIDRFGALCAYTMDGSEIGEFTDETFSAQEMIVSIHGVDVHPGPRHRQARQRGCGSRPTSSPPFRRTASRRTRPRGARASSTSTASAAPRPPPRSARSCATSTRTASPSTSRCCRTPPAR